LGDRFSVFSFRFSVLSLASRGRESEGAADSCVSSVKIRVHPWHKPVRGEKTVSLPSARNSAAVVNVSGSAFALFGIPGENTASGRLAGPCWRICGCSSRPVLLPVLFFVGAI
jgi:hypothetical protein